MVPLHAVALGLVVVALVTDAGGWDLLADPAGWALVLLGAARLPVEGRGRLLVAGALALVASAVVWPPAVAGRVADADASLAWALSLPQAAALLLLADSLRRAAAAAGTPRARSLRGWLLALEVLAVLVALLPAVVLGAGVDALAAPTALLALLLVCGTVVVCLAAAREPWSGGRPRGIPRTATKSGEPS